MARPQPGALARINWANPITVGLANALIGGIDHIKGVAYPTTSVDVGPSGRTERAPGTVYYPQDDVAACTLIGHHKYTSDNSDYQGLYYGFYINNPDTRTLGIGMGPFTGSQIFAVNRINANTNPVLETVTFPYEAIWAISCVMDGSAALAYKNGAFFSSVAFSGTAGFATDSRKRVDKLASGSSGKESAWFYKFNRVLSAAEIASLSADPYQIFMPLKRSLPRATWLLDATMTGWTVIGAGGGASAINELVASDTEYITSPMMGASAVVQKFPLLTSKVAGTYSFQVKSSATYGGTLTVRFLDSGNSSVGSVSQALTSTLSTYSLNVTLTGTATQVQFEATNP